MPNDIPFRKEKLPKKREERLVGSVKEKPSLIQLQVHLFASQAPESLLLVPGKYHVKYLSYSLRKEKRKIYFNVQMSHKKPVKKVLLNP